MSSLPRTAITPFIAPLSVPAAMPRRYLLATLGSAVLLTSCGTGRHVATKEPADTGQLSQQKPMRFDSALLSLAGFAFGHAAWSLSDLPESEILVPLAFLEKSGQRRLLRFEAESQEEAVALGKATLAQRESEIDAWAFARDGQFRQHNSLLDVLVVEAKTSGTQGTIAFVQPYRPFALGEFRILGAPHVLIDSVILSPEQGEPIVAQLMNGLRAHSKAAESWARWTAA